MSRKSYHVTPRPDGNWSVKAAGSARATTVQATQANAVKQAVELAKHQPQGQVIIHGRDGKIRDERTYQADPFPPKG